MASDSTSKSSLSSIYQLFIVYTTVLAMTAKIISNDILGNVLTAKITKKCLETKAVNILERLVLFKK